MKINSQNGSSRNVRIHPRVFVFHVPFVVVVFFLWLCFLQTTIDLAALVGFISVGGPQVVGHPVFSGDLGVAVRVRARKFLL
jgi:hypothetical protein